MSVRIAVILNKRSIGRLSRAATLPPERQRAPPNSPRECRAHAHGGRFNRVGQCPCQRTISPLVVMLCWPGGCQADRHISTHHRRGASSCNDGQPRHSSSHQLRFLLAPLLPARPRLARPMQLSGCRVWPGSTSKPRDQALAPPCVAKLEDRPPTSRSHTSCTQFRCPRQLGRAFRSVDTRSEARC